MGITIIYLFILFLSFDPYNAEKCYLTNNHIETQDKIEILDINKYSKIEELGVGAYHYTIYNKNNEIVREADQYRTYPYISFINEYTIKILTSAGTNVSFSTYYDINNDKFSKLYNDTLTENYGKVVYYDFSEMSLKVIVSDIFDEDGFYKEINLDFSKAVSPVYRAEFLDENTLLLSYISGELYEKKTVIIYFDYYKE